MFSLFLLQKSDHEMRSNTDHIMSTQKKKVAKEYIILNESLVNKMKKKERKFQKFLKSENFYATY